MTALFSTDGGVRVRRACERGRGFWDGAAVLGTLLPRGFGMQDSGEGGTSVFFFRICAEERLDGTSYHLMLCSGD